MKSWCLAMCEILAVTADRPLKLGGLLAWATELERLGIAGFGWGVAWAGADGEVSVLLQLRSGWGHHGGTWGLPGGAMDSHESPEAAALPPASAAPTMTNRPVFIASSYRRKV